MHYHQSRSLINTFKTIAALIVFTSIFSSCKKFVEVPPPSGLLVTQNIFTSDATASSAVLGIYSRMVSSTGFASGSLLSIPVLAGLSADEFDNYAVDPWQIEFYTNTLTVNNNDLQSSLWDEPYQYIYTANVCIEGLNSSTSLSPSIKNQLLGESKFIRAFCYFYLVNLFGEVPLLTQSDYSRNAGASRDSLTAVYKQIEQDLKDAEMLLVDDYSFSGGERVRPNKSAAQALLARVYLYQQNWVLAEQYATSVIEKTIYFALEPNLDSVFLAVSREAIWQLKPNQPGYNTNEASVFIFTDQPTDLSVSEGLLNSFEPNDARRTNWVDSATFSGTTYYYPFKYKIPYDGSSTSLTEYSAVLRLAETYLIRAEARARQNNISGGLSDLNIIRTRAGLPYNASQTSGDLINAILAERRIELFSEWGQRWLDLKRTQTIDSVMTIAAPNKGSTWNSNQQLYPIPQTDRQSDPNLTQNPGY